MPKTSDQINIYNFFESGNNYEDKKKYYGFLEEASDCKSSNFASASYNASNGEFSIQTTYANLPSITNTHFNYRVFVNGGLVHESLNINTSFSYTITGRSKMTDTEFEPSKVELVIESIDKSKGCVFNFDVLSLEKETIKLSNVGTVYSLSYSPLNDLIQYTLADAPAKWTLFQYPDDPIVLPNTGLSYDLSQTFLASVTSKDHVSFKVKILGKVFGSTKDIAIPSNSYQMSSNFNTVLNGENLYSNVHISYNSSAQTSLLLFIDNSLLLLNHFDAILNSNKTLTVVIVDNQPDRDFFIAKGTFVQATDYERYETVFTFTIPTYSLAQYEYNLLNEVVGNRFKNSENIIKQTNEIVFGKSDKGIDSIDGDKSVLYSVFNSYLYDILLYDNVRYVEVQDVVSGNSRRGLIVRDNIQSPSKLFVMNDTNGYDEVTEKNLVDKIIVLVNEESSLVVSTRGDLALVTETAEILLANNIVNSVDLKYIESLSNASSTFVDYHVDTDFRCKSISHVFRYLNISQLNNGCHFYISVFDESDIEITRSTMYYNGSSVSISRFNNFSSTQSFESSGLFRLDALMPSSSTVKKIRFGFSGGSDGHMGIGNILIINEKV
jgi:hypothetical protein